jgi:predicted Fe-S protein YdhL (DUF1289 family)
VEQIEIFEIPSPCKGICEVNNRGYCKGCYRSRDERFNWGRLTAQQKRAVIILCRQRYARFLKKKASTVSTIHTNVEQQNLDF